MNAEDYVKIEKIELTDELYDKSFFSLKKPSVKVGAKKPLKRKNKVKIKKNVKIVELDDEKVNDAEDYSKWIDVGLPQEVSAELTRSGFLEPTPVQASCLPTLLHLKKDAVVAAETGSGKTLAYILPILNRLYQMKGIEESTGESIPGKLRCLIITPTRELALQVKEHASNICKKFGFHCIDIIGGMSGIKQERLLDKRPEIVVGTPGRIWTYMEETPHVHLTDISGLKLLVIDEVDRMTEQGHFFQLRQILDFIRKYTTMSFPTYVFSATLSVPKLQKKYRSKKNETILQKIIKFLGMSEKSQVFDLTGTHITPKSLEEYKLFCHTVERELYLYGLLVERTGKFIIFVNTIVTSNWLKIFLTELGIPVLQLHSHMAQKCRLRLYDRFKKLPDSILIATDVASRGLDIYNIHTVVHYNTPKNPDLYVHRSGRTARVSLQGRSILMVIPEELHMYQNILKALNRKEDLADLPLTLNSLEKYSEVVSLATKITETLLEIHQLTYNDSWFSKNAESADTIIDPNFCKIDQVDSKVIASLKRKMLIQRKELKSILSK